MDGNGREARTCTRCDGPTGAGRYCAERGLDLQPEQPELPTAEALEAAERSVEWQQAHEGGGGTWLPTESPADDRDALLHRAEGAASFERLDDYRSARILALILTRWLALFALLSVAVVAVDLREASLIERQPLDVAAVDSLDDIRSMVALGALVALVVSYVLNLAWFWRAYSNLPALGILAPRFGRGWVLGAWFVPFLALWRPKQVANDVWRSGEVEASVDSPFWSDRPLSALLTLWWAAWLGTNVLDRLAARREYDPMDTFQFAADLRFDALTQGAWAIAAVLNLLMVRAATKRQGGRDARLRDARSARAERAQQPVEPALS